MGWTFSFLSTVPVTILEFIESCETQAVACTFKFKTTKWFFPWSGEGRPASKVHPRDISICHPLMADNSWTLQNLVPQSGSQFQYWVVALTLQDLDRADLTAGTRVRTGWSLKERESVISIYQAQAPLASLDEEEHGGGEARSNQRSKEKVKKLV